MLIKIIFLYKTFFYFYLTFFHLFSYLKLQFIGLTILVFKFVNTVGIKYEFIAQTALIQTWNPKNENFIFLIWFVSFLAVYPIITQIKKWLLRSCKFNIFIFLNHKIISKLANNKNW